MIPVKNGKSTVGSFVRTGLFAFLVVFASMLFASVQASAESRTLKLFAVHTNERIEITYKKDGRYQQDALNKLNYFLRDWRRNEPTKMDPRLFDLVWEIYQKAGGRDYIHVICGYRSPATNSMLRSRTRGVAQKSQHMLGKALDWYLPGVKLQTLRYTAMRFQAGGVGYYPTSGSPFVHTDVGNVRHWPRMSRQELLAVFPDGKTMHIPSDGKPLPGYEQAVAAYQARQRNGGSIQVASSSSSGSRHKTLFGALFGGGADEDEDSSDEGSVAVASAAKPAKVVVAKAVPTKPVVEEADDDTAPVQTIARAVPLPKASIEPDLPVRDVPAPLTAPRPAVPLATSPEEDQALAFNVPVPVRRPDYAPAPQDVASLNALAADDSTDIPAPMPRPNDSTAAIQQLIAANTDDSTDTAGQAQAELVNAMVPVPSEKPKHEMTVASIVPDQRPVPVEQVAYADDRNSLPAPADHGLTPAAIIRKTAPVQAKIVASLAGQQLPTFPGTTGGRVTHSPDVQMASAEPQPSLRRTMLEAKGDPVAMLDSGVITTAKSAKPSHEAAEEQSPKAIKVSSDVPDRALSNQQVADVSPHVEPAVLRNALMRTAPTTVYVAGFQPNSPVETTSKFTGKAVTFLQIAKFNPASGF
jgi:uncharacterized protein YcbK (DUF882 family)